MENEQAQEKVKDIAMKVMQNELNNANARIIQLTTELVIVKEEVQMHRNKEVPTENPEEEETKEE